jgi:8-amino-7-oxononanoate synthase
VEAPGPFDWLADAAADRAGAGLRRTLDPRPPDDHLLDLASNDYLGLARDPRVVAAAVDATRTWGAGSTGSRLVTGTTELHLRLEATLASVARSPAALTFSSGYLANLGALVALSGRGSLVVSDAGNHASLVDACRLSRARVVVTPHGDPVAVATALADRDEERALVVTDSVFSVDGEAAPLAELAAVCAQHGAGLLVDEAHALGVVGPGGAGLVAALGLDTRADIVRTATLSKALGSQGGAVLATVAVVEHLVSSARPFVFDTALAPAAAGAALAALDVLRATPELPERTRSLAACLHDAAAAAGLTASPPGAAVVGVRIGDPTDAVAAAAAARAAGVRVGCFRPPSVPDGISRLRLTARADLTAADFDRASVALEAAAQRLGRAARPR